jgi:hypothetical protein
VYPKKIDVFPLLKTHCITALATENFSVLEEPGVIKPQRERERERGRERERLHESQLIDDPCYYACFFIYLFWISP